MRRKGYDFKLTHHLTFRPFNPDLDLERLKDPPRKPENYTSYCVPVSVKAVRKNARLPDGSPLPQYPQWTDEERDAFLEAVDRTPCLPFDGWSRTNMVYGCLRRRNDPIQVRMPDGTAQWQEHYWTRPIYWVEDGRVYTTSTRITHQKEAA